MDENIVRMPMNAIEKSILNKSVNIPVSNAPITYPKSLQNLNTPKLFALCFGLVSSAIADRKVG